MANIEALYDKPGAERYYQLSRTDVVNFLEPYLKKTHRKPKAVLEIGCSGGGTGTLIKERLGVEYYAGLELMPDAVREAKTKLDWAAQGNIEEMIAQNRLGELPDRKFDMILFLDVLEHLYNPWQVLESTSKLLNPGGLLIGSIPNAGNLYVLWKIMRDHFEYEEEGLLDNTTAMGDYMLDQLHGLKDKHAVVGDVRGKGLFLGAELVADRDSKEPVDEKKAQAVVADCNAQGVIIGVTNRSVPGKNNTLCFSPALIAKKNDIDHIVEAVDGALGRVFG